MSFLDKFFKCDAFESDDDDDFYNEDYDYR